MMGDPYDIPLVHGFGQEIVRWRDRAEAAEARCAELERERDAPTHRKQNVEYWRARTRFAEAELSRLREQRDALREALTAIRDCAKWYGEGERLPLEVHHALVVEVYAVADMALTKDSQ